MQKPDITGYNVSVDFVFSSHSMRLFTSNLG